MAKYNAANHTIESDTGELLATLSPSVRSDEAFTIADNWGDSATKELRDQIDDLGCEIQRTEDKNSDLRDEIADLQRDIEKLERDIEGLKEELAEKGDAQ